MHTPTRSIIYAMLLSSILVLSGCNAPVVSNQPDGALATQSQALGSDGSNGDGSGSAGDVEGSSTWTWGRPEECQVPQPMLDNNWFSEMQPSEETFVPGCPTESIWHGELRVTHMWHTEFKRDDGAGEITVDAGEPALVELLIYPGEGGYGEVVSNPEFQYEHPVLLHGTQTFGDKVCSQVGSGHYTIDVSGICKNGWIILTHFEMPFFEDEPTKLHCDGADPQEVTTFVPDGTPGLTPCFRVSYGRPHGVTLTFEHGEGKLETTMLLVVGDADLDDIIIPIPNQ